MQRKIKDRTPGKQSDCATWWMLLERFLFSLSAFLFLALSPSPTSPRLFLQTLWQHQSKQQSQSVMQCVCADTHTPASTQRRAALERNLFFLNNNFFNVGRGSDDWLFPNTSREWCWWKPPCCFLSSFNQTHKYQQNKSCIPFSKTSWRIWQQTFWVLTWFYHQIIYMYILFFLFFKCLLKCNQNFEKNWQFCWLSPSLSGCPVEIYHTFALQFPTFPAVACPYFLCLPWWSCSLAMLKKFYNCL